MESEGGELAVGPDKVLAAEHLSVWQHQAGSYQLGTQSIRVVRVWILDRLPAGFIVHELGDKHGVCGGYGQGESQQHGQVSLVLVNVGRGRGEQRCV